MIRNKEAYLASLWDWDVIASLPRGIRPTDVDGLIVLPSGQALFLEGKYATPTGPPYMNPNQHRAFCDLLRNRPGILLLYLGGESAEKIYWWRRLCFDTATSTVADTDWHPTTTAAVRDFIRAWFDTHDTNTTAT